MATGIMNRIIEGGVQPKKKEWMPPAGSPMVKMGDNPNSRRLRTSGGRPGYAADMALYSGPGQVGEDEWRDLYARRNQGNLNSEETKRLTQGAQKWNQNSPTYEGKYSSNPTQGPQSPQGAAQPAQPAQPANGRGIPPISQQEGPGGKGGGGIPPQLQQMLQQYVGPGGKGGGQSPGQPQTNEAGPADAPALSRAQQVAQRLRGGAPASPAPVQQQPTQTAGPGGKGGGQQPPQPTGGKGGQARIPQNYTGAAG